MFDYDFTLEESGVEIEEKSNKQQVANNLAKASVIACVALAGYTVAIKQETEEVEKEVEASEKPAIKPKPTAVTPPATSSQSYTSNASNIIQNNQSLIATVNSVQSEEEGTNNGGDAADQNTVANVKFNKYVVSGTARNVVVKSILDILLTPFIANKLASEPEQEVLKTLTQNTRNPYLMWDNGTRTQLLDFLEYQRQNSSKEQVSDITDIYNTTSKFVYDATRDELKIGGVYIRIYNEQPTFPIINPKLFVIDLLEYLKQAYLFLTSSGKHQQKPLIPSPPNNKHQEKNVDHILNDYNRSKIKNQLEKDASEPVGAKKIDYDFASDKKFIEHLIMTMNSLISVIKLNPNVELQCIGNFDILFGFLSINACEMVSFF
jgi:DnaJ family protein C protein 13